MSEDTGSKNCIENQIKSWIEDESVQSKLFNAQKSCVFVSTDDSFGSGICIDSKGIILTAKHCIDENIQISFADLSGKQSAIHIYKNCKYIEMSDDYDLALIQIDNDHKDDEKEYKFPLTNIATKPVKKGDGIYIIGHPANSKRLKQTENKLQQNICGGRIIGLPSKKSLLKQQNIMGGIKHNCVTFGGHSGAPLLNVNGEIVGIHVTCDNFEGTAITQQAMQQFIRGVTFIVN